jgi:hypothetical protein
VIGRKAYRGDNPADKEENDQQESNPKWEDCSWLNCQSVQLAFKWG